SATPGNLYPSTLLPSHHIQAEQQSRQPHHQIQKQPQPHSGHHHRQQQQQQQQVLPSHSCNGAPVKLLQSCDSCRRRKIRCSGEKPTCSACIRYQEICHYSPLATPRRRVGKRARLAMESAAAAADVCTDAPRYASSKGAKSGSQPLPAAVPTALLARDSATETPPACGEDSEVGILRQELQTLTRKFDALSEKMDVLLDAMDRKRRSRHRSRPLFHAVHSSERASTSDIDVDMQSGSSDTGEVSDSSGADPGSERGHGDGQHEDEESGHEFSNLVDKTSRFGIDATNIGVISDMINSMDRHGGPSAESVRVTAASGSATGARGTATPAVASFIGVLEGADMQQHLIDTFFLHADVSMISFIPRQIFQRLQREDRTPTSM
ncbi:hypothetical protein LPJ75_006761, partial [Coemansia sp. RSA 2598]